MDEYGPKLNGKRCSLTNNLTVSKTPIPQRSVIRAWCTPSTRHVADPERPRVLVAASGWRDTSRSFPALEGYLLQSVTRAASICPRTTATPLSYIPQPCNGPMGRNGFN